MKNTRYLCPVVMASIFLLFLVNFPIQVFAGDTGSQFSLPDGIQLNLTREFYESLLNSNKNGNKIYSNDPSLEYLKEIAISTRFMVETNFKIMEQNERIIELLQSSSKDKKK